MKRIIFLAISTLLTFTGAFSQTVGYLQNDKRVYKGVMENGLTYYLVKNSAIAGYADFTLIQKRNGELYGNGRDAGLAKLTECLSLTETNNFPDGRIFIFLNNMGLDDRKDIKIDATNSKMTFSLKNVPLSKNANLLDSVLLSLYNISSGVIFDDNSLLKGKEFFANIFPATMTLSNRVTDSLQRYYFKNDSSAFYNPAEIFSTVVEYTIDDVRQFYENNYRPDMQALIIVGDFDVKLAEAKIKSLFQTIHKPKSSRSVFASPKQRKYGEKFFYFKDCEANCTEITVNFPIDKISDELKNTAIPFVYDYLSNISAYAIKWRLIKDLYDLPFYVHSLDVDILPFLNGRAFSISLQCAPCDYKPAYAFLASEINRLVENGLSESEFKKAEEAVFSDLQYKYDGRGFKNNEIFTNMCIANFMENFNIVGIELYKSYIDEVKEVIDANILNKFIKSLLDSRKNCTVTCVSPKECGGLDSVTIPVLPHYEDYQTSIFKSEKEEMKKCRKDKKLVNNSIGFVYSLLDNGTVTVYKNQKIEPGWISFEAVSPEGISLTDKNYIALQKYINEVANISKTGGMNKYQLAEIKATSLIELERVISVGESRLVGKFHKDHLDEFFQLVALYFDDCEEDWSLFEKYAAAESALSPYSGNSPEDAFKMFCMQDIFTNRQESFSDNFSAISSLDYRKTLDFVNFLFSNAANFSFIFIGDFDEELLAEKANLYIGSLPGTHRVRRGRENNDFSIVNYNKTTVWHIPMEFPRCLHNCKLTFPSKQNVEERALSEVVALIIRHEIKKKFSRDGFLIASDKEFYNYPQEIMTLDFRFSSASELQYFENDLKKTLADLAERGVGVNELKAAKKDVSEKNKFIQITDFDYWHSILRDRFISNKDFFTNWEESVNAVDKEKVNDFLRKILAKGNISLCSVVPENKYE